MMLLNDPQRPQLSIPEADQRSVWDEGVAVSSAEHRWTAFLNQLTVNALLPWIAEHSQISTPTNSTPTNLVNLGDEIAPLTVWPSPAGAAQLWEWLNGTLIQTPYARLLLLPTDAIDTSEFRVPREWVDIPDWVADYYLMVQLNPDAELLQIRGYVSHRQLKQGHYSSDDHSYCVDESVLVQDLDLLWVMAPLESATERRAVVETLPELTRSAPNSRNIDSFLQSLISGLRLSPLSPPRLLLPLGQWATLLSRPEWRDRLHPTIEAEVNRASCPTTISNPSPSPSLPVQLGQWLQGEFEAAWLSLEQLCLPQPSFSFRSTQVQSFSRGKVIILNPTLDPIVLCTTVITESDEQIGVRVQLKPSMPEPSELSEPSESQASEPLPLGQTTESLNEQQPVALSHLPPGLQLILLAPSNEALQVVTAQEYDDYIQLPRFKVLSGQSFIVEIRWGEQIIREQFQV